MPLSNAAAAAALCFATIPLASAATAQAPAAAEVADQVAEAIVAWTDDHEGGRLAPHGPLDKSSRLRPRYVAMAQAAGFLSDAEFERLTHLDVLQKLLFYAEKNPGPALTEAVLGVAAAGLDGSVLDRDSLELRELGHWTLMRVEDQSSWFVILRAAAGERVPVLDQLRPAPDHDEAVSVGAARRVAALRLLGQRGLPVFRSTLEAALEDREPRVRLGAAEALQPPWRLATVQQVARLLAGERHPVVSQALVRLLLRMLERPPEELGDDDRQALVEGALAQFGRAGWRTDMDLLDVVEAFPHKAAIPRLIELLDLEQKNPDALVTAINKRASPLLRERAGGLLKAMTGALVPVDDVAAWRAFWAAEKDRVVVPARLPKPDPEGTQVTFFGVPVKGGSIAFLIDTSGSMDDPPAGAPETGRRARRVATRLDAAKEQLVLATQAMLPQSQFLVLTFAGDARRWTQQPLKPSVRTTRSLTELLSRLNAHGGTNLYAGLVEALEAQDRRYGDGQLPQIDELFVLSDGEPTAGDVQDPEELLELVAAANKYAKVRIHAVFTGAGAGKGPDLLKRLAEQNGGVFVQR
ncbi:MAG: VWA domain-containing protein [Planctomycetes bacterium]|nr:VWA domain-containing protein [Planctomycetota bacterium]